MPLFARLVSSSAFNNGDSFAIVAGSQRPIRAKCIIHGALTNLVVFSEAAKRGVCYTGEINTPELSVLCLEGCYYSAEEFLAAKTRALAKLAGLKSPRALRFTGPTADFTSRIGNGNFVELDGQGMDITIWHLEPPENGISKFWFAARSGSLWRAESSLCTHKGIAQEASFE